MALLAALGSLTGTAVAARQGRAQRGDRAQERTTSQLNADSMGRMPRGEQPDEHDEELPPPAPATDAPRIAATQTSSRPAILASALTSPTAFAGPSSADSQLYPPDTMGDVGPTQYIAMVNGRVRSYSKTTGSPDGILDADTDVFWSSVMTPVAGSVTAFTTDPHIRYDRLSQRWIAVMIDDLSTLTGGNRIMIAVSPGPTIAPSTVWRFFYIQGPANEFSDYPTLGVDRNAIYIGTNQFNGGYLHSDAYVVQKASILGSGPIVYTRFGDVTDQTPGACPYTPQGVDDPDPLATTGYFAAVDSCALGKLDVLAVSNPASQTPALTTQTLSVPATQQPRNVPYAGHGSKPALDAIDDRLFAAQVRDGHLWTAHSVGVTAAGTSPASFASVDRTGSRWYEIALGSPLTLTRYGTFYDTAASSPRSYWFPSVAVNGQGTMAVGGSTAGALARPDAWFSSLQPGDAAAAAPTIYTSSTANYQPPYNRWGDYSYTSVDPTDDQTMWTMQEYAVGSSSWGTRIAKLLAPAPAAPVSASPAVLPRGRASVTLTLTGPAGAGWFDPGAGFARRFAVSLSCGATVNGVTLSGSTATVDVNTTNVNAAACGVTVTNPDGQSATAAGLVSGDAAPVAVGDRYAVPAGAAYHGTGLLANDTDADSTSLTAAKASDPAHGTVTVAADGSFTYTPAPSYTGDDSFTYTVGDGALTSDPATVALRVIDAATDHAPVAVADDLAIPHGGTLHGNVVSNDTDADGDPLYATKLTDPQHGALTLGSDGAFTYTAAAGFRGADSFTYRVSDGVAAPSAPATVTLTGPADAAPAAVADAYSLTRDTALDGASVLANDLDDDHDALTAVLASSPVHGALTFRADGTFRYVPDAGFTGVDSFAYAADDGLLRSAPASVALDVSAPAADPALTPAGPHNGDTVPLVPTVRCVVPPLRGHTLRHARHALAAAHCGLGAVRRVRRAHVPRGLVVSTSPAAGRRRAAGTRVNVVVRAR